MITVIAGTNRPDSMTLKVANVYFQLLKEQTTNVALLSLENKQVWERGPAMLALEKQFLVPAEKFLIVMPEYNASFPGILKLMMDNSDIKNVWWYKKAALVGLSDGRAGNIRGLDHMTAILNYLRVNVLYNKVILSGIGNEMDKAGILKKKETAEMIQKQIDEFVQF